MLLGAADLLSWAWFLPDGLRRGGLAFLLIGDGSLAWGVNYLLDAVTGSAVGLLMFGVGGLLGGISFVLAKLKLYGLAFLGFGVGGVLVGAGRCALHAVGGGGLISSRMGGLLGLAFLLFGVASLLAGLALLYRPEQGQRILGYLNAQDGASDPVTSGDGDSDPVTSGDGDSDPVTSGDGDSIDSLKERRAAFDPVTVTWWRLSVQPTCTPRAGPCADRCRASVHWSTVGQQLQSAGITIRHGGPSAHPAST